MKRLAELLHKLHFALVVILFLVLFILIYALTSQFHKRFNFRSSQPVALSVETENLLKQFSSPVSVKAFFSVDDPRLPGVRALLEEFRKVKPNFEFTFIDPDQYPKEAEKHKIDQYGALIAEVSGKRIRTQGFREEDVSLALARLLNGNEPLIYFVKGHREANLYDRSENGYSEFYKRLKSARYQIKDLELGKQSIPANAALVMVTGPHADFSGEELGRLEGYLKQGGKLLIAVDPVLPGEGEALRAFISKLGIGLGADAVVDGIGKELTGDYLMAAGVDLVEPEFFEGLDAPIFFPLSRSVRRNPLSPAYIHATELLRTGDSAWAETNLEDLGTGKTKFDEGLDYPGPIPLAAISRIDYEQPAVVMVLGDSEAWNNRHFRLGSNQAFMFKLIALLTNDRFEIKEKKTTPKTIPFVLTPKREAILFGSSVIAMPILFVVTGLAFYFLRRRQA